VLTLGPLGVGPHFITGWRVNLRILRMSLRRQMGGFFAQVTSMFGALLCLMTVLVGYDESMTINQSLTFTQRRI